MTRLSEIEARLKAATGGEWQHDSQQNIADARTEDFVRIQGVRMFGRINDCAFIAHCGGDSGDLAYLLALVKTLTAGVRATARASHLGFVNKEQEADWQQALRAAKEAGA